MVTNILKALVEHLISDANTLVKGKYTNVFHVQNELFPDGVYRIHIGEFLPGFMVSDEKVLRQLFYMIESQYRDNVVFDTQSGWLTFKGQITEMN
jgi:hypothetical protein